MSLRLPGKLSESPPAQEGLMPSAYRNRRISEDSIRTELCEGPVPDDNITAPENLSVDSSNDGVYSTGNRDELIQRIKRGEKTEWTPSLQLARLLADDLIDGRRGVDFESSTEGRNANEAVGRIKADEARSQTGEQSELDPYADRRLAAGLEIERPRSALHSGDFNGNASVGFQPVHKHYGQGTTSGLETLPSRLGPLSAASFMPTASPEPSLRLAFGSSKAAPASNLSGRSRTGSSPSTSPGYILKPPTSPLAQETSNDDQDFDDPMIFDSPSRSQRRHTLTPGGSVLQSSDYSNLTQAARQPASLRREATFPWQGHHHHRRSLNLSSTYQLASSPTTPPFLRSRAPSYSSDASPRQTSMVGSYEESILRGRMSGAPSQPLNFTAEIGALGKNGCKPTCPAHVYVGFPAVFYSWTNGTGRVRSIDQEPSPYVGKIDLGNNLSPPQLKDQRRIRRVGTSSRGFGDGLEADGDSSGHEHRKRKRREPLPHEEVLGGCYRIPQQGSIQLIIRNPNKTATKVFIVPYDLEGMELGTKTWVRQRCYSAGPVIEKALTSKTSSDIAAAAESDQTRPVKPTLRYLVHFKICCPSKGRFYLYDEIRVVFANRVPDNKENLKSEVQMPDTKFTPLRPRRQMAARDTIDASGDDTRAYRRRSYGFGGSESSVARSFPSQNTSAVFETPATPVPPIPTSFLPRLRKFAKETPSEQDVTTDAGTISSDSAYLQSPSSDRWARRTVASTPSPETCRNAYGDGLGHQRGESGAFTKLKRGDVEHGGGLFGRPATPEPGEGLIARRLRGLEVDERDDRSDER